MYVVKLVSQILNIFTSCHSIREPQDIFLLPSLYLKTTGYLASLLGPLCIFSAFGVVNMGGGSVGLHMRDLAMVLRIAQDWPKCPSGPCLLHGVSELY